MGQKHAKAKNPPPVPNCIETTKESENNIAANKIQSLYKIHKENNNATELTWKMFNDLENREEAEMYQLSQFLQAVENYMPHEINGKSTEYLKQASTHSIGSIDISEMYKGLRLNSPFTNQDALDVIAFVKRDQLLHEKYVLEIIHQATMHLQCLPNVSMVDIRPATHITIVGDLHGQLDDLLLIFRENGTPSDLNPYCFNGDIVDRGEKSVEVAILIYLFMILYPNSVYINRGNHEDRSVTTAFGFMKECQAKYNTNVYNMFIESFSWLPLATVIDKRIIVLHGGVPRSSKMTINDIGVLPRSQYVLARPAAKAVDAADKIQRERINVIRDILWSDPQKNHGYKESKRGAGIVFGPDVAEKFLKHNHLKLIVRSHECVPQGFSWPYGKKGMLVTLFSASNYCGKANNLGAFMKISADVNENPAFYQYKATTTERDMTFNNLNGIFSLIVEQRAELMNEFKSMDSENTGAISMSSWAIAMENVLQLQIKWKALQPLLTHTSEDKSIPYVEFLDRYNTHGNTVNNENNGAADTESQQKRSQVFNELYRHRSKLEALFRVFDKNGDGTISHEEFTDGLKLLNSHLPAGMAKFGNGSELMKLLDMEQDNSININEFMESFRINAKLTVHAKWRRAKIKLRSVAKLRQVLVPDNASAAQ